MCKLDSLQVAVERMLQLRQTGWTPAPGEWRTRLPPGLLPRCNCNTHTLLFVVEQQTSILLAITNVPRIGLVQMRQIAEALQVFGLRRMQLISEHTLSIPSPFQNDIGVVSWAVVLLYPLDHEMVPPHRRATPEERAALRVPLSMLPVLRRDDAIAQYLGLQHGDVVRIDRLDGTVYWRHVVMISG